MTTIAQVRKAALALPEVVEGTHFGMVAFSVSGNGFASVTEDGLLQVQVGADQIEATLGDLPVAEPLVRMGTPIGVRVPLAAINGMQSNALVRRGWLARAPKRLVAADQAVSAAVPGEVGDLPASIGRPATRALAGDGVTSLADLAQRTEAEVGALHGVGPKAVRLLDEALKGAGLRWRT